MERIKRPVRTMHKRPPRVGSALLMAFCVSGVLAQDREEVVWAPLTNSVSAAVVWQPQHAYGVSADAGGTVEGTASGWLDEGTTVSNRAVPAEACMFAGWLNAPEGLEQINPLVFALDTAWTNVVATFAVMPGGLAAAALPPGDGPGLAAIVPEGLTVKVQRATSLSAPDWQEVGEFSAETGEWSDGVPPEGWKKLYYRLAE